MIAHDVIQDRASLFHLILRSFGNQFARVIVDSVLIIANLVQRFALQEMGLRLQLLLMRRGRGILGEVTENGLKIFASEKRLSHEEAGFADAQLKVDFGVRLGDLLQKRKAFELWISKKTNTESKETNVQSHNNSYYKIFTSCALVFS